MSYFTFLSSSFKSFLYFPSLFLPFLFTLLPQCPDISFFPPVFAFLSSVFLPLSFSFLLSLYCHIPFFLYFPFLPSFAFLYATVLSYNFLCCAILSFSIPSPFLPSPHLSCALPILPEPATDPLNYVDVIFGAVHCADE